MSDLPEDRFAGSSLRMAALSLLLHQVMKRANRHGPSAAARERVGHDLTSLLDGAFGGRGEHAPEGVGGIAAGLDGLVHAFREHGLGREVESWIGHGPNLPISIQQVAMVIDLQEVDSLARRAGTDRESLLREVAALLPEFVHRITPEGRLPVAAQDLQRAPGGLGGLLDDLMGNPAAGKGARGGAAAPVQAGAGGAGAAAEHRSGRGAGGSAGMPRFADEAPGPGAGREPASGSGAPPLPRGRG